MRVKLLLILSLMSLSNALAQDSTKPPPSGPPIPTDAEKPELTRRALPTDTFKPSEQVSEDFPVPFPVDI